MGSCCSTDDVSSSPLFHDLEEDPYDDFCHHCCKQTSRLHNVVLAKQQPMLVCEACQRLFLTSA